MSLAPRSFEQMLYAPFTGRKLGPPRKAPSRPTVQLQTRNRVTGEWQPLPRRHAQLLADELIAANPGKYRVQP